MRPRLDALGFVCWLVLLVGVPVVALGRGLKDMGFDSERGKLMGIASGLASVASGVALLGASKRRRP